MFSFKEKIIYLKQKEKIFFLVFCFLVVFSIYGRTLAGDFVLDDRHIVEHELMLSDLNKLHQTLTAPFWSQEEGLYRPITLASYTFNYVLFGVKPWGFHLVNLVFYALSGYLIFLLVGGLSDKKFLAYFPAILFLVLPIHTEVAANIAGRAEILALFFSLLVFWELSRDKKSFWRPGLWFLLALGSKETAIAALPIAVIFTLLREGVNFDAKKIKKKLQFFQTLKFLLSSDFVRKYFYLFLSLAGGAAVYFLARFLVLGRQHFLGVETSIVENPLKFVGAAPRIYTALQVLSIYLKKTFWPFDLCSDYSYNQIPITHSFFNGGVLLGAAALIFFCAAIFIFWQRSRLAAFGAAIFLFSFLPVANLIFPIGTITGERLIYFPSLGIIFFIGVGFLEIINRLIRQIWKPKLVLEAVREKTYSGSPKQVLASKAQLRMNKILPMLFCLFAAGLIIFYSVMSFRRAGDWLSEKRLFISAGKCAPNSVLSRSNLGAIYYLEGDYAAAKNELLKAQEIYSGYPKGVNNLGLVYWKTGEREKAREYFLRALALEFPYYGAYENLALMALEEKKVDEARDWLLRFYSGNKEAAEFYIRAYRDSARGE